MLSYVDYISETIQSTAECQLKEQGDQVAQWVGHEMGLGWKGAVPLARECFFLNFQVRNAAF